MRSHSYQFTLGRLTKTVATPVLGLTVIAVVLQVLSRFELLPQTEPMSFPEQTLLVCKAELSRTHNPAEVVLLGDSSCATGVDAPELEALLPGHPRVFNLGLVIGMGLEVYSDALTNFLAYNPDSVRLVVLLVTPELLTDESRNPISQEFWRRCSRAQTPNDGELGRESVFSCLPGTTVLRNRLLKRLLHTPLEGLGAQYYGFSSDLADYVVAHRGSMVDPAAFHAPPHPFLKSYYLSASLEAQSRRFRSRLPPLSKLAIGLTPLPQSLCLPNYPHQRNQMLIAWNRWMEADYVLTNAPARLSDVFFATGAHLNRLGQERFTKQLAEFLRNAQ